ncbi:MAG: glycosyltransferase [Methylococcaceae bacterium]|jgi:glycosyltransferase involved in cell wall biosynthesis
MKVLHILCELNPSGAETMLLCAAPTMQEYGIQSEILATGNIPGVFADTLENAGYKIHHIPFRKNIQFFISLYRLLKKENYDSVQIHTEQASFWITLVILFSGMPVKRCIRTIHATFSFTGFLGWRRSWQRQLLSYLGVPHIAISKSVQETELKHFKLKTNIISNWYDSNRFIKTTKLQRLISRQEMNLSENSFVIVTVGNCSAIKNHGELIKAIAKLGNKNIVYLHIGVEKDNSEQDLANQLNITDQIRFLGLQSNILPFLQAADLFIMPSLHEGFGIAAIEAIATEVPTLLTSVPGLIDFADIFNGLHYCEPTTESMKTALENILAAPKEQLKLATLNNAKEAEQRFGINRSVSAYAAHFQS